MMDLSFAYRVEISMTGDVIKHREIGLVGMEIENYTCMNAINCIHYM